jgi:hypothetical protein
MSKSELSLSELFIHLKDYNCLHPTTMSKDAFFNIVRGLVQKGARFMIDHRNKNVNNVFDKLSGLIINNKIDVDQIFVKEKYSRGETKKILGFLSANDTELEDFMSMLDPFYNDTILTEKIKQVFSTEIIEGKMKFFGRPNFIISQMNAKLSRGTKVKLLQKLFNADSQGIGFLREDAFVGCFGELTETLEQNMIRELFQLISEQIEPEKMININYFCNKLLTHSEQFE